MKDARMGWDAASQQWELLNAWLCGGYAFQRFRAQVLEPAECDRLKQICPKWERLTAVEIWMMLHGVSHARAVIDLAKVFGGIDESTYRWLLREFCEAPDHLEDVGPWARRVHGLVIDAAARQVYWHREQLECDWDQYGKLWNYFVALAVHTKEQRPFNAMKLCSEPHQNLLSDRRNRLKGLKGFPSELVQKIVAHGKGRQQLDIPRTEIHILNLRRNVANN